MLLIPQRQEGYKELQASSRWRGVGERGEGTGMRGKGKQEKGEETWVVRERRRQERGQEQRERREGREGREGGRDKGTGEKGEGWAWWSTPLIAALRSQKGVDL